MYFVTKYKCISCILLIPISVSDEKDLTFQFIDANSSTQSLANLDLQPFILLKYDTCQLDRKSRKLRRRQKRAQAYSRFLNSKILLPSLIWNEHARSKRQTNLCKLEKFQITTEDLGHSLSKRIISPTKMVLNRCVGSCRFINSHQLEMSYHARFMMFARYINLFISHKIYSKHDLHITYTFSAMKFA